MATAEAVPLSSVVVLRSPLRHLCPSREGSERGSPARRKGVAHGGTTGKENPSAVHFAADRACITPGGSLRVSPLAPVSSNVSSRADTPTKALTFGSLA